MSTEQVYHYVYRITNIVENKHYYGKRSSKVPPKLDIGVKYFSSSTDKAFIEDQKANPQNYKYKVVSTYSYCEEALLKEIKLHNKFDVGKSDKFYNKSKQTSNHFVYNWLGIKQSKEHIAARTSARKGLSLGPMKEEHKLKISNALKGREFSEEHKDKLKNTQKGASNSCAKLANIYDKTTNEIIAEKVTIKVWAETNGYNASGLHATARSDRTKEYHWKTNVTYYKHMYARYI